MINEYYDEGKWYIKIKHLKKKNGQVPSSLPSRWMLKFESWLRTNVHPDGFLWIIWFYVCDCPHMHMDHGSYLYLLNVGVTHFFLFMFNLQDYIAFKNITDDRLNTFVYTEQKKVTQSSGYIIHYREIKCWINNNKSWKTKVVDNWLLKSDCLWEKQFVYWLKTCSLWK